MRYSRWSVPIGFLLAIAVTGAAQPADASILPRVDFHQGNTDVAIGLFDAAVDYAVLDRLSVGAALIPSIFPVPFISQPTLLAGRLTWRGGEVGSLIWGATGSLMAFRNPTSGKTEIFVQPATWPGGRGRGLSRCA